MSWLSIPLALFAILIGILLNYYTNFSLLDKCELDKCPYCFGEDYCFHFQSDMIKLEQSTFQSVFNNYFSVKNVYSAHVNNKHLIMKKLGSNDDFNLLDNLNEQSDSNNYEPEIKDYLLITNNHQVKAFKVCSEAIVDDIIQFYLQETKCKYKQNCLKNLWTILQINPEPLMLMVTLFI